MAPASVATRRKQRFGDGPSLGIPDEERHAERGGEQDRATEPPSSDPQE